MEKTRLEQSTISDMMLEELEKVLKIMSDQMEAAETRPDLEIIYGYDKDRIRKVKEKSDIVLSYFLERIEV